MKRYKVTFYQYGVYGIAPEFYKTKRAAMLAACEFLACMLPMPGHKRVASVYRDNYARIVDYRGATEAMAEVHDRQQS
jgi:hypothetical protein